MTPASEVLQLLSRVPLAMPFSMSPVELQAAYVDQL
jgi:hypothetical protein